MAGNVTGLHRFADDVGPVPLSLLDTNFDALTLAINTLNTYSNFYVDTGTTNALTITPPSTQSVSYGDGLIVSVRVAATNTGPSTLNIGTLGPQPIQTATGAALGAGALQAGSITDFVYNASRNAWQLKPGGGGGGGSTGGPVTAPFTVQDTAGGSLLSVQQPPLSAGVGIVTLSPGNISNTTPGAGTILQLDGSVNSPALAVSGAVNTQPNYYVAHFQAPSTAAGLSNGVWIAAGTNNNDSCFQLENAASADNPANRQQFMIVRGDGSGALGPYPNQLIWNAAGQFSLTGSATLPGGGGGTGGVSYLSQLLDVSLTSQTQGQALTWNSGTSRWTNTTITTALSGLTDVALSSQTNGQVLTWNSATSRWTNQASTGGSNTLAGLTDCTITSPTSGQFLSWNGTHWVNVAAPAGGGTGNTVAAPFTVNDTAGQAIFQVQNTPTVGQFQGVVTMSPGNGTDNNLVLAANGAQNFDVAHFSASNHTTAGHWVATFGVASTVTAGMSNGILITAGTNSSDYALEVQNNAANATYLAIRGDGTGALGVSPNNLTWSATTFTFTTNNPAVQPITVITPPSTTPGNWLWQVGTGTTASGSSPGCSNGMAISAGTNASDSALKVMSDGETKTFLNLKGDGSGVIGPASSWDVNGVWTFGPTNTGVEMIIRGAPHTTGGLWKYQIGGGPSGDATDCSNGLYVGAGTSVNDVSFWVQNDAGNATYLQILGTGAVYMPAVGTTATAANVVMDSNHQVLTSTSVARVKRDVETLGCERAKRTLRELRAVSYRSRCTADDPRRMHYGLIAEEVAAVDPNLVTWDSEGKPQGVQYERIAMLLLPLMQELLA